MNKEFFILRFFFCNAEQITETVSIESEMQGFLDRYVEFSYISGLKNPALCQKVKISLVNKGKHQL